MKTNISKFLRFILFIYPILYIGLLIAYLYSSNAETFAINRFGEDIRVLLIMMGVLIAISLLQNWNVLAMKILAVLEIIFELMVISGTSFMALILLGFGTDTTGFNLEKLTSLGILLGGWFLIVAIGVFRIWKLYTIFKFSNPKNEKGKK